MKSPRSKKIDDALLKFKRQEIDGEQLKQLLASLNPKWYQTGWFWVLFVLILILICIIIIILIKNKQKWNKSKNSSINNKKATPLEENTSVFDSPKSTLSNRTSTEIVVNEIKYHC